MEFESPDVEKEFPGLYASESGGKKSNESDFSDDSHEKHKKDLLLRSKDKKESKKDRGYAALEGESSPDEADADMRSPSKSKKSKSFKFPSKKEKREKSREKEGGREAEQQRDQKDKKKEKDTHRVSKLRSIKDKKAKSKHAEDVVEAIEEPPVFGVALEVAVARSRCHDGVQLPLVVRECLDFVEECGLTVEGIYKSSGNKSRAQQLRRLFNQKETVSFTDVDPVTVAGLLKLFLRELPEPVVPASLAGEFEEAAGKRGEGMDLALQQLPAENRELLGWVVLHCKHLVAHEKLNKCGGLQGVCATFSPLLQTSSKVLSALICYSASLFPNLQLSKYIPPLSGPSPALPSSEAGCREELRKLESLLAQVHGEMNAGLAGQRREEQLWDAQRIVTQLKRKLRTLQKPLEPRASDDELRMDLSLRHEEDPAPTSAPAPVVVAPPPVVAVAPVAAPASVVAAPTISEPTVTEPVKVEVEEKKPAEVADPPKEPQVQPEEIIKKQTVVPPKEDSPTSESASIEAILEAVLEEGARQASEVDEEEEILQQRALQHQLELLAEELAGRVAAERAEVQRLRQELTRAQDKGRLPERKEQSDLSTAELLEQNQALQQQRDKLCFLIMEEREAMAWTRAQLNLRLHQLGQPAPV